MKRLLVLLLLSSTAYAADGDAFVEGFSRGLTQAIAARQGYQADLGTPSWNQPVPQVQENYYQPTRVWRTVNDIGGMSTGYFDNRGACIESVRYSGGYWKDCVLDLQQ